jgi:hypothetical protein
MNSHTNTQFLNCYICKTCKHQMRQHNSVINNSFASKFFQQANHQTSLSPHTNSIPASNPSDLVPPYATVVSKTLHHPHKILLMQNSPYCAFQGPIPRLLVIRWKASEACLKSDSIPG